MQAEMELPFRIPQSTKENRHKEAIRKGIAANNLFCHYLSTVWHQLITPRGIKNTLHSGKIIFKVWHWMP
jgi:hypothetical protein